MKAVVDNILAVPGWAVLLLVGALVFAEDALFVGFVLPGETAALLGGVAARFGHVTLWAVLVTVVGAAIVGDSVGYEVGRLFGDRILRARAFSRRRRRLEDARAFLARRGGWAVVLGRWIAFFRAVMPALAGAARMPYRKFVAFNAGGGITWGVGVVMLGYVAGASYSKVEQIVGPGAALTAAAIALAGLLVWHVRRRRAAREAEASASRSSRE
jgi:membrane protein DedA with SNARE-associated domain